MGGPRYSGETPWRRTRQVIVGARPAAGQPWSVTVPAGQVWDVVSVFATLVADANVAARTSKLLVGDGSAPLAAYPGNGLAATQTGRTTWAAGVGSLAQGTDLVVGIARMTLEPGWTLGSEDANLQAGDQYAAPRILAVVTTVRDGSADLGDIPDLLVEVAAGLSS